MDAQKKLYCCNPFDIPGHSNNRKNLRAVQQWMIKKTENLKVLQKNFKVCGTCRLKISKMASLSTLDNSSSDEAITSVSINDDNTPEITSKLGIAALNESLSIIGETPIKKKRLIEKNYPKKKLKKVSSALRKNIFELEASNTEEQSDKDPIETEIISQLKCKFNQTTSRSEKMLILTILPQSWSIRKIETEFSVSNHMARNAKRLVKERGILSTPNPKPGRVIDKNVLTSVIDYYLSDDISRCMPGKKDCISIRENGVKIQKQKRLILNNLKEIHEAFKKKHPELKIGFSKFCELRPKNCVLAGASGTHTVCVCVIHQNVKLMMKCCKINTLTANEDIPIKSYTHCLASMICNPPMPDCYFGQCENCPGSSNLYNKLENLFEMSGIDEITYSTWISTDRAELINVTNSTDEFLDIFIEKLKELLPHAFLAFQQNSFLQELKSNLEADKYIIQCDFAENYSFILQDEIQGFHWNNGQATIHPFLIYFKKSGTQSIEHITFVIISDCLKHDTTSVHLFQRYLKEFLCTTFAIVPHHIYYFSDGAAAHYKNRKNFLNLCYHKEDFGISAEWHFFATAHGKGPCDGIAGTIKRLAARASLQRPYSDQIMTPRNLFEWAKENISTCHFAYVTQEDYEKEEALLEERFESSRTIPGTQKKHAFVPINKEEIKTKIYSNSESFLKEKVTVSSCDTNIKDIKGFVTCMYDGKWWVGCVINTYEDTEEIKISFLHPHGPSPSFTYPFHSDILIVPKRDILTQVDLRTATGRTYTLTKDDIKKTDYMYIACISN